MRLTSDLRRLAGRVRHPGARSDEHFLERAYLELFGRPLDPAGRATYLERLRDGTPRESVLADLRASEEHQRHVGRSTVGLPDLHARHPDRYARIARDDGRRDLGFDIRDDAACDWIETAIIDNGFYEKPGVWVLEIDLDKRVMAEIVASLEPASAFEVGCSSGGVLAGLDAAGIDVTGVDISEFARDQAPPPVRDRIVLGDVVRMPVDRTYDVAFGLDIFEHVNPRKLDAFIGALVARVADGGYVVVNVPAYGTDAEFGEVFPVDVPAWRADAAAGRRFGTIEVDERGYPLHGHLVLADTDWWVARFEAAGVHRVPEIERALHARYDAYFDEQSPARKSLYVFAKRPDAGRVDDLATAIRATPSRVLDG